MGERWLDRWEAAESQWVIHEAILIDLPAIAVDALGAGWDSPTLRVLAGVPGNDPRDTRDAFLRAVEELHRQLPTPYQAAARLVRFYSAAIADGRLKPISGAQAVASLGYDFGDDVMSDIMTFVGLEDEWLGQGGRSRDDVAAAIVTAARNVVAA
jgi:hypothetical protein